MEKYLALYGHLRGLPSFVLRASNVYGQGKDPFGKQGAINVFPGEGCAKGDDSHVGRREDRS